MIQYLLLSAMKKIYIVIFLSSLISLFLVKTLFLGTTQIISGAPPYDPSSFDNVTLSEEEKLIRDWKRPEGPAKVLLQVGHWKNDEVPEELKNLRGNTGATGRGKSEWEVNYEIAMLTKVLLEKKGIMVEILPATVPPHTWGDVFVAIHADGSLDTEKSGYKVATSRRDITGNAQDLVTNIEIAYEQATGLEKDPVITRKMRGYYAFSWWRYEHAVHPMTASAILETGFLTSYSDQTLLIDTPEVSAEGLANGVISYLSSKSLL